MSVRHGLTANRRKAHTKSSLMPRSALMPIRDIACSIITGVNIYTPNTSTQTAPDVPFTVKVSISDLNIRKGPGTDYAKTGKFTGKGVFTIVEVQSGQGSSAGWGRLKSGAGWISLDYAVKTE